LHQTEGFRDWAIKCYQSNSTPTDHSLVLTTLFTRVLWNRTQDVVYHILD